MTPHDPALSALLEQLNPPTHAAPDWDDVLRRAVVPHRPARRGALARRMTILVAAVGVAVAAVLLLASPWRNEPSIVDRASAALALTPQTILSERFTSVLTNLKSGTVTRTSTEIWLAAGGRFRTVHHRAGNVIYEIGREGTGQPLITYNQSTNTLHENCSATAFGPRDPVAVLRNYLAAGKMRVSGEATIKGRAVVRIRGATAPAETDELFVDRHTYIPVQLRTKITNNVQRLLGVITWTTYQRLSATPATTSLTDIKAQHPSARLTSC